MSKPTITTRHGRSYAAVSGSVMYRKADGTPIMVRVDEGDRIDDVVTFQERGGAVVNIFVALPAPSKRPHVVAHDLASWIARGGEVR